MTKIIHYAEKATSQRRAFLEMEGFRMTNRV